MGSFGLRPPQEVVLNQVPGTCMQRGRCLWGCHLWLAKSKSCQSFLAAEVDALHRREAVIRQVSLCVYLRPQRSATALAACFSALPGSGTVDPTRKLSHSEGQCWQGLRKPQHNTQMSHTNKRETFSVVWCPGVWAVLRLVSVLKQLCILIVGIIISQQ